jgi:hypothetical protein
MMMAVLTIGAPLGIFVLLYRYRRRINPGGGARGLDAANQCRLREADSTLREAGFQFLYQPFKPNMLYAAPLDLLRRVMMIGVVSFCGKGGLRAFTGAAFALFFLFVIREAQRYNDHRR